MTTKDWTAVFDWDGVIVDSSSFHEMAWEEMAATDGLPLPEGHFKRGFGMKNEKVIPDVLGWAQEPDEVRALGRRKEEMYRRLVREKGLGILPGVRAWIARLREAGIPCVIGSSTERANIECVLELHGIRDWFDDVISGDDVVHGKPAPDIFLKAAAAGGRGTGVVFEDAHVGIEAARAAGFPVIAVTTTHPADSLADADLVIDRLDELTVDRVDALLRGMTAGC